jgi:hypothetical protein
MTVPNLQAFFWVLSILVGILGFFGNLYRAKVDALEKALAEMAQAMVSRFELQKHLDDARLEMDRKTDRMHDDSLRMHTENLARLVRIDDAVIRVHQRLDAVGEPRRGK